MFPLPTLSLANWASNGVPKTSLGPLYRPHTYLVKPLVLKDALGLGGGLCNPDGGLNKACAQTCLGRPSSRSGQARPPALLSTNH